MRAPAALPLAASSLAASFSVLLPWPASAFPSSRLVYSRDHGAEQCPTEEVVRREVASRLGYDPFFPSADRIIIAEVAPAPKGFRATVHLVDKTGMVRGKRELRSSGRDCAELLKSIALAISIAIDPDAVDEPHPPAAPAGATQPSAAPAAGTADDPASQTVAPQPAGPAFSATSAPQAPQESRDWERAAETRASLNRGASAWNLVAGAGLRVASGVAPATAGGGTLFFGASWRWLTLALEGTADLPASNDVVRSQLFTGSFVGCAERSVLFGCVLGSIGALVAKGQRSDRSGYAAIGARVGASAPLGHTFALRAYLEGTVPVGWSEIVLTLDSKEVWSLPRVAGAAGTQLMMRFP